MDTIDTSTADTIDIESVHKKVKLNGDVANANSIEKNDSEEEFDFSSSDLEDLDSVNSAVDETDNINEPLSTMAVKSHDNDDDNQLIEAKNDIIINMENGDSQSVMVDTTVVDTVVGNSDISRLSECSNSFSNECNDTVDSTISTNNNNNNTSMADQHQSNEPIINSKNIVETSTPTKFEEDDAYSDEDGAIVNFLGKANEIVGLVNMTILCVIHVEELCGLIFCFYVI